MLAFGREMAEGLGEMDGEIRVLPRGVSWNQDLQDDLRRCLVQSAEESKVIGPQRAKSANRSSGISLD